MMIRLLAIALSAQPAPPAPPPALAVAWEVAVPGTSVPMLIAMRDTFAVATSAGRIAAYGPGGGAPLWQTELGVPVALPPIFAGERLAVVAGPPESLELVLIDPADGRPAARTPLGTGSPDLRTSSLRSGILLTGTLGGASSIALIDPADASTRWRVPIETAPSAPAAQCGPAILVGGPDGTLIALAAADGALQWKKKISGAITTAPLCNGRRAYVGSADNRLHALRLGRRHCRGLWSYPTGGDIAGRMVLFDQRVHFFSYDTYLYSIEADNGHLAWKVRLGRRPREESLLSGSLLVVAQLNTDRLECFSLPGGAQAGILSLSAGRERFVTAPVRVGGRVVVGAARYGEEAARILGIDLLPEPDLPRPSAAR